VQLIRDLLDKAVTDRHGHEMGRVDRIIVGQILAATDKVKVDYAFGETAAANVERTLHGIVSRIPGANR
jgi:hypothetical protein